MILTLHGIPEPSCAGKVLRSGASCLQELGTSKEQQANGSKGPATIAVGQQVEPFISGTFEYGLGRPASKHTYGFALCMHALLWDWAWPPPLVYR